uniref:TOG domain-containing protein n=1 Tax=Strigamia maritima TaxID=126957 RepID=T1IPS6_STRMM
MWLAEDLHDTDPGSPPLEGGEALCEFNIDSCNQEIQHLNVLRSLPSLLEENKATCIKDVFSKIQAVLPNSQAEVHLEASNSFLTILERELVPATTFTQTFLQSILTSVDSKDQIVANAWLETLLDVIDLLPPDIVKKDILTLAIYKGQHSHSVTSRLASCKILGKICLKFEGFFIKKEILPTVQSLCQDVDYEVRSCIARQLDAVARGLGLEIAKYAILPCLVELSNDEAGYVRLATIETVVNMLSLLDDETCTQTIIPLVKKFCETSLIMEDSALPIAAKQLGRLCHGLSLNLQLDEKSWFLQFYRKLARLGLPISAENDRTNRSRMPDIVPLTDDCDKYMQCRQNCAYNFPAMVLFAEPINFKDELLFTFYDLASDPYSGVRRTIASGLHEISKLLGPNVHLIQRQLVLLLQDDCIEVLEGVLSNLPITLEALAREGSMNSGVRLQDADDLITALIACERAISATTNWRLHAEFLNKLSCLPRCLSSDDIHETFVPLIFQKIYSVRPMPCRIAAITTLLIFLRSTIMSNRRQEICTRLVDDLANGYSCHKRMLFITACTIIIELFSKQFFKTHFFSCLLKLTDDPIPNIRLRLCSVLPRLKSLIKLPVDQKLLRLLEAAVRKLVNNETDKDVSAALGQAILELDNVELLETDNRHSTSLDDAVDLAKEDEEKLLVQLERKLKFRHMSDTSSSSGFRGSRIPCSPSRYGRSPQSLLKYEIRSAIPLPKRSSSLPLTPSLNRKILPDSPVPSPETIRRASSTIPRCSLSSSHSPVKPSSLRYNSTIVSPPLSPSDPKRPWVVGESYNYKNSPSDDVYGTIQDDDLQLDFSDDMIIAHLNDKKDEKKTNDTSSKVPKEITSQFKKNFSPKLAQNSPSSIPKKSPGKTKHEISSPSSSSSSSSKKSYLSTLSRAKSTSHLNSTLSRQLGSSFIPRASFRSSTGRSPSAPGTPRCMSPVRIYGTTKMGLSLPLSHDLQYRLGNRKFLSRPGSPAALSSEDSDGQNTPDSPCSYGSNESASSEIGSGSGRSRVKRLSANLNSSKIPFLIPRSTLSRNKSLESQSH